MVRSSEVVMRLNGLDATDGMFDLVFSRPQGTASDCGGSLAMSCVGTVKMHVHTL